MSTSRWRLFSTTLDILDSIIYELLAGLEANKINTTGPNKRHIIAALCYQIRAIQI